MMRCGLLLWMLAAQVASATAGPVVPVAPPASGVSGTSGAGPVELSGGRESRAPGTPGRVLPQATRAVMSTLKPESRRSVAPQPRDDAKLGLCDGS